MPLSSDSITGASASVASSAVVLSLIGGMIGKFCAGFLAARLGDCVAFVLLQLLTILGVVATITLPAPTLLMLLPLIGLAVQGSSTVTYGSVADFVHEQRHSRGYALIYTSGSCASVVGPFLFGLIADDVGLLAAFWLLVVLTVLSIPMAGVLSRTSHGLRHA